MTSGTDTDDGVRVGRERNTSLVEGIVLATFGLLFLAGGVYVGGTTLADAVAAQTVADEAVGVDGTVTEATVVSNLENDAGELDVEYYPRVTYTYEVDGKTYTGERIYAPVDTGDEPDELRGRGFESRGDAAAVVTGYTVEERVTVFHEAGDPARAFLRKPTVDVGRLLVTTVFGTVAALIGLAMVIGGGRRTIAAV